jgi:hypothetical protein
MDRDSGVGENVPFLDNFKAFDSLTKAHVNPFGSE